MRYTQRQRFSFLVRYTMRAVVTDAVFRGVGVQLDYLHIKFFAPDEFIEIWAMLTFKSGFSVQYFDAVDPDGALDHWQKEGWRKWKRFIAGQAAVNEMLNVMLAHWEAGSSLQNKRD